MNFRNFIFSFYLTNFCLSFNNITPRYKSTLLYKKNKDNYDDLFYDTIHDNKPKTFKDKYKPLTDTQKIYYENINNDKYKLIIANGPAGTGKTLFPTQKAAELLTLDPKSKVIITRPLITTDEDLGFLPGNINKKMDPWMMPIFDIFRDFFCQKDINTFIADKRLEIVPLAFMRGRTFKNAYIIGDELQNSSINQMLMLLTRLGDNSKMVITGDIQQCDNIENGLEDLIERIENAYYHSETDLEDNFISLVNLNSTDIQRSPIVNIILNIYG